MNQKTIKQEIKEITKNKGKNLKLKSIKFVEEYGFKIYITYLSQEDFDITFELTDDVLLNVFGGFDSWDQLQPLNFTVLQFQGKEVIELANALENEIVVMLKDYNDQR